MKYIIYNRKTLQVAEIRYDIPTIIMPNYALARCEYIPPLKTGEYHEVFNIQEHTETYTEKEPREIIKKDEVTGEEYTETEYVEVEKERTFYTCELVVMVDNKLLKSLRLRRLKSWFNNEYRYYAEKFTRFIALDINEVIFDKFFGITYSNINDLYLKAESVRAEINNLETEI